LIHIKFEFNLNITRTHTKQITRENKKIMTTEPLKHASIEDFITFAKKTSNLLEIFKQKFIQKVIDALFAFVVTLRDGQQISKLWSEHIFECPKTKNIFEHDEEDSVEQIIEFYVSEYLPVFLKLPTVAK